MSARHLWDDTTEENTEYVKEQSEFVLNTDGWQRWQFRVQQTGLQLKLPSKTATFTIITACSTSLHSEPRRPIKTAAPAAYWLLNSDPGPRLIVVLTWFP